MGGVPRAGGDEPVYDVVDAQGRVVFPARAGMNRIRLYPNAETVIKRCSPRGRG